MDFDNTIIRYDAVFVSEAVELGLIPADFVGTKQLVRDTIRLQPGGETAWQKLQGYVYGKGIVKAHIFADLDRFLYHARDTGAHVSVVSHKTEFGHYDPDRVNLRVAAIAWMEGQGFFAVDGFGIRREDVHFAPTRAEKLARIAALGFDVFIDDLEEVLGDPDFPAETTRILFSEHPNSASLPYHVCATWRAIERVVFP